MRVYGPIRQVLDTARLLQKVTQTRINRDFKPTERRVMLRWTLMFLIVALIAGVLGFGGIAGAAAGIARILFVIFLVFFLVSLIGRRA